MKGPLVSIITPSYNQGNYIERTIKSVQMQDYQNIEHIVVDGGSSDNTIGILKKYPNLRWISEKDSGQSNAINKGFRLAKGEIVGWLNSDDTYREDAVSAAVNYLAEHPDVGMVYSRVNIVDENDKKIRDGFIFPYNQFIQLNMDNCIPQPSIFFRRSILSEIGYLDESLHYVMDYEFWLRMGRKKKIAMIPGIGANFRIAKGTKTNEKYNEFYNELLKVNRLYGGIPYLWHIRRHGVGLLSRLKILSTARWVKNNLYKVTKV